MIPSDIQEALQSGLGELYTTEARGELVQNTTPYLLPDNDCVTLYCRIEGDAIRVTDLGETCHCWLAMEMLAIPDPPNLDETIDQICADLGVEHEHGEIFVSFNPNKPIGNWTNSLAGVVARVTNAVIRVSDLWYAFRPKPSRTVNADVADFLQKRGLIFTRSETHKGCSGDEIAVTFSVDAGEVRSLMMVLDAGMPSLSEVMVESAAKQWMELKHLTESNSDIQFVTLFDDTSELWTEKHYQKLKPLSVIAKWSQPENLAKILTASQTVPVAG